MFDAADPSMHLLALAPRDLLHAARPFTDAYPRSVIAIATDEVRPDGPSSDIAAGDLRPLGPPPDIAIVWHPATAPPTPLRESVRAWIGGPVIHALAADPVDALDGPALRDAARALGEPLVVCEGAPQVAFHRLLRAIVEPILETGLLAVDLQCLGIFRGPALGALTHWQTSMSEERFAPPPKVAAVLARPDLRSLWAPLRVGDDASLLAIDRLVRAMAAGITVPDWQGHVAATIVHPDPDGLEVDLLTLHDL